MSGNPFPIDRSLRETEVLTPTEGQTSFGPTIIKFWDIEDVEVWLKPVNGEWAEQTTGFSITKEPGIFSPITVTFSSGLTAQDKVYILSRRLHERLGSVTQGGKINSGNLERELDRVATNFQEVRRDLSRLPTPLPDSGGYDLRNLPLKNIPQETINEFKLNALFSGIEPFESVAEDDDILFVLDASNDNAPRRILRSNFLAGVTAAVTATRPKDVAALQADTILTYTAGLPGTVSPGVIIETLRERYRYEIAASSVTDQDLITANGVKLYVLPVDDKYQPEQWGATGTADDGPLFQKVAAKCLSEDRVLQCKGTKTYTLLTWTRIAGKIRIEGNGATIRGPVSGGATFSLPTGYVDVQNVKFDRWKHAFQVLLSDPEMLPITGGKIIGNHFTNNGSAIIYGLPINLECPVGTLRVSHNEIDGAGTLTYIGIRIGTDDETLVSGWNDYTIFRNKISNISAIGTQDVYAILSYGSPRKINHNRIYNVVSVDGRCFGIYTKNVESEICGNTIILLITGGVTVESKDCVAISMKGDTRVGTPGSMSPAGRKLICMLNHIRTIGAQDLVTPANAYGTGIRSQNEENFISKNTVEDVGNIGIDVNDNGVIGTTVIDNFVRGNNIVGLYGIWFNSKTDGGRIVLNRIRDFVYALRFDSNGDTLSNLVVADNWIYTTQANAYAFRFGGGATTNSIRIEGNDIVLPGDGMVFLFGSAPTKLKYANNNDKPVVDAGGTFANGALPSDMAMDHNTGFKTKMKGAASIPTGGGGSTAHGLIAAPTYVKTGFPSINGYTCAYSTNATNVNLTHNSLNTETVEFQAFTQYALNM
ncbi:MAG: hypothetical protein AAF478_03445 [Pseudomonadota bacterium]